jgi:hypothetical protein
VANIAPQFGSGVLFGVPNAGNILANPTAMQFGLLQEISANFKADLKKLFTTSQFPAFVARGKIDVSVKGKMASLDPLFFSQLYFGLGTSAGVTRPVYNEAQTAASSVTPSHTPVTDLGVIVTGGTGPTIGTQMNPVLVTPTVSGTYEFTGGTYKFLAADVTDGLTVALSYTWADSSHGTTLEMTSQLMGYAPQFQAILYNNFRSSMFALQLNACILGSVSIPTKQEDFWVADFDMEAFADTSGVLGYIYSDVA